MYWTKKSETFSTSTKIAHSIDSKTQTEYYKIPMNVYYKIVALSGNSKVTLQDWKKNNTKFLNKTACAKWKLFWFILYYINAKFSVVSNKKWVSNALMLYITYRT